MRFEGREKKDSELKKNRRERERGEGEGEIEGKGDRGQSTHAFVSFCTAT